MKNSSLLGTLLMSCFLLVFTNSAKAALVYESATGPFDGPVCCSSLLSDQQFFGARFTITEGQTIDGIGGHFRTIANSGGSIFGAIVHLDSSGFPSETALLLDNIIASTLFVPTYGSDFLAPINATLAAGTYGIVFGSGLFGATGQHGLTVISPGQQISTNGTMFFSNNNENWEDTPENRHRVFVSGSPSPVPVPAAFWLFGTALIGLVQFGQRKGNS